MSEDGGYDGQDRGDAAAYDHYLRGMDASMRQKVALTAAHLLCEGDVADMGMGSGSGSEALASLYPHMRVVGVDVNPEMVERARARFVRPNLRFLEGDIAKPCFEPDSMEAIVNSSVLHHVTTFNGYARHAAIDALAVQTDQLAAHGVVVVRDFVDPGPGRVWLDLPADDGDDDATDPVACSSAALFERFAREFRRLLPEDERGFPYERLADPRQGWRRYAVDARHAVEFVLRKDYRASWDVEVLEEYTYATQAELESACAGLGLRVLASTPIRNPWIVTNRFEGKMELRSETGEALDVPATNIVVVGQKVPNDEGVRFTAADDVEPLGYLDLHHLERRSDGRVFDLARRPGMTFDVLPWFEGAGGLYVLARRSYPRPVLAYPADGLRAIDGARAAHYITEPLNVQRGDLTFGQAVERALDVFPDLRGDAIATLERGPRYYPSPGGILEEVRSALVAVPPVETQAPLRRLEGMSTAGVLRAIEARQLLRAAQVGGLPDARLELNTYELLMRRQVSWGDWIGEALEVDVDCDLDTTTIDDLLDQPPRRAFGPVQEGTAAGFLDVRTVRFEEHAADGRVLHETVRELVLPGPLSLYTVVVMPLCKHRGAVHVGLDDDDLPAAQCFRGDSRLLVAPAWRLPHDVRGIARSRAWVRERLEHGYGATAARTFELGGRYHPSPGLTPEVVYPLAMTITGERDAPRKLRWVPLDDAVATRHRLVDGHLRVALMRLAHALS